MECWIISTDKWPPVDNRKSGSGLKYSTSFRSESLIKSTPFYANSCLKNTGQSLREHFDRIRLAYLMGYMIQIIHRPTYFLPTTNYTASGDFLWSSESLPIDFAFLWWKTKRASCMNSQSFNDYFYSCFLSVNWPQNNLAVVRWRIGCQVQPFRLKVSLPLKISLS